MMKTASSSSRGGRVVGQACAEPHAPVVRNVRAHEQRRAQHQQRVGEQRSQDRRLGHDHLARGEGEQHHEQLGQVAERGLQHPGDRGAEVLADLLRGEGDHPREAAEGDDAEREHRHVAAPGVVQDAGDDRDQHDRGQDADAPESQRR
jgi:hypothetical protein